MFDWFLEILNKPFAALTLLDLLKVVGAFIAAGLVVQLLVAFAIHVYRSQPPK